MAAAFELGVILSTSGRTSAVAPFKRNAFKAAFVFVYQEVLDRNGGRARGLVVSRGCADTVTGERGIAGAWAMMKSRGGLLVPPLPHSQLSTLMMSTKCYRPDISHREHHVRYRRVERRS